MKPLPPPLTFRLSSQGDELVRSDRLGEILDRRSNAIGFRITQPLSERVSLKIANRLSQKPRQTIEVVKEVDDFFQALKHALELSPSRWYWFVNPDHHPPAGTEVIRIDSIHGPDYECYAGYDECVLLYDAAETDIRAHKAIEVSEGIVGVESESVLERYATHLDAALASLSGLNSDDTVGLALVSTQVKKNRGAWKTFSRKRLERRAKPLTKVAHDRLTPRLLNLGFERQSMGAVAEGAIVWTRKLQGVVQYIAIDRNRFDAAFRVFLSIGDGPFTFNNSFVAELLSGSPDDYTFSSQAALENALDAAYDDFLRVGIRWLGNPHALSRKEWLELRLRPK